MASARIEAGASVVLLRESSASCGIEGWKLSKREDANWNKRNQVVGW